MEEEIELHPSVASNCRRRDTRDNGLNILEWLVTHDLSEKGRMSIQSKQLSRLEPFTQHWKVQALFPGPIHPKSGGAMHGPAVPSRTPAR